MARLSPEHRTVLGLVYYRGMSIVDVAKELGIPAGIVKARAYYALRALRLMFDELGVTSTSR
jgi:RNA polymerase sigma-70 factor (ECF subfamily)